MPRFILLLFISILFSSCTKEHIVIKTIGQKPLKELNIKIISRITIPVVEEGYKNFSTTLITSQKELNSFLSKVESQQGWQKKENFLKSLNLHKIDFTHYNLLLYRINKASTADVLLVGLPKGDKKTITIKIGIDDTNATQNSISHYAVAYKISKSISKIRFKDGAKEDVIKNSASEKNSKIPESCIAWFDGCNSCSRSLDNDTPPSCTELSCKTYKEFKCTKWKESSKKHETAFDSLPHSIQFKN